MRLDNDLELFDNTNMNMDNFDVNSIANVNSSTSQMPISNETKTKFNEGIQQIISNIKDMQTIEIQLYTSLDNQSLTVDERNNIITRINQIGETRMTLYNSLNNMASSYQQNVSTSQKTIQQQLFAIDIVENELNEARGRMKLLENQKYDKLRLVEINTYYGKQFSAHKDIVKVIVLVCILLLIIIILGKKEILPRNIYILLNGIIIVIGIIIIGTKFTDLSNRDNMNFDEYDWYFDKTKAPSDTSTTAGDPWAAMTSTCIGEMCCHETPGLVYDNVKGICVADTTV